MYGGDIRYDNYTGKQAREQAKKGLKEIDSCDSLKIASFLQA